MQKIGKEIKIGLAVIGVLVAAFGYILFRRLTRPEDLAAAPPAATSPSTAAPVAGPSDKPTVVSATDTGRPADPATDGANSSRSLFGSTRRPQTSDSADAGAEPRGSFMPAANSDATAINGATASNGTSGTTAAPESRFSQFGHHDDAPSAFRSGTAAPSDPFQRRSAAPTDPVASDSPDRHLASPLDAPASPPGNLSQGNLAQSNLSQTNPPADPSPPQQAGLNDSQDGNPLRHAHDGLARTASATSPETAPADAPHSMFSATSPAPSAAATPASTYSSAQTVPPPITPNAISIPSAQTTPSEPVSPAQPLTADAGVPKPGQYIVQPNDNYWTVSEKVYGTGGYFKAIYEHNRRQHSQSDRLQVGDALDVPDVAMLQQAYPELCPKLGGGSVSAPAAATAASVRQQPPGTRLYVVAEGDTLYEIARRELGRSSRWGEIYQLNHDQLGNDFDYLHAGTQLLIPSDASAAAIAREPAGTLQR